MYLATVELALRTVEIYHCAYNYCCEDYDKCLIHVYTYSEIGSVSKKIGLRNFLVKYLQILGGDFYSPQIKKQRLKAKLNICFYYIIYPDPPHPESRKFFFFSKKKAVSPLPFSLSYRCLLVCPTAHVCLYAVLL